MCGICGGTRWDRRSYDIFNATSSRGKDYGNLFVRGTSWICNHRAIPTTEKWSPEKNQPFGTDYKVVHNGMIANDKELGNVDQIDSSVLSKVLSFSSIEQFVNSLSLIVGSFAIAVMKPNGHFYLACNYKPIWVMVDGSEIYFTSLPEFFGGCGGPDLLPGPKIFRLPPYSAIDTETLKQIRLPRKAFDAAVVVASGGLDSTAVAAYACENHSRVCLLHFQYGCLAENKETDRITKIAQELVKTFPKTKTEIQFLPIDYGFAKNSSTLLDGKEKISESIAGSEYAHEWVPARNLVMLSLATAFAEANDFSYIYLGTNLEEGGAYPDNEEQFIRDFNSCLWGAVQNGKKIEVRSPLGSMMKHEIVAFGLKHNAPFEHTWSCYRNGEKACGHCGPCYMRQKAFLRNGLLDPVDYEERISEDEQ